MKNENENTTLFHVVCQKDGFPVAVLLNPEELSNHPGCHLETFEAVSPEAALDAARDNWEAAYMDSIHGPGHW